MCACLHVKYALFFLDLIEYEFSSRHIFRKTLKHKFHEKSVQRNRIVPCGQTDMMKPTVAFHIFVNVPKTKNERQCHCQRHFCHVPIFWMLIPSVWSSCFSQSLLFSGFWFHHLSFNFSSFLLFKSCKILWNNLFQTS